MKCLTPIRVAGSSIEFPCGKCYACACNYSKEWSLRIYHEFINCGQIGCMLTLTYEKTDGNLHREDLQKFIKRLRKKLDPVKIRYFYCGEYGGKGSDETPSGRPHYHMIIFGWKPDDLKVQCIKNNVTYYSSDFIKETWSHGFISVGDVTLASAKYCAKYLAKLDDRPHEIRPFVGMSLKPGIGAAAVSVDMLLSSCIYLDGKRYRVPKYYLTQLERKGINVAVFKAQKEFVGKAMSAPIGSGKQAQLENARKLQKLQQVSAKK